MSKSCHARTYPAPSEPADHRHALRIGNNILRVKGAYVAHFHAIL